MLLTYFWHIKWHVTDTLGLPRTTSASNPILMNPNPNPSPLCVHVGCSLNADIAGAASAGFLPVHFCERFDEKLPDWGAIEGEGAAEEGVARRTPTLFW